MTSPEQERTEPPTTTTAEPPPSEPTDQSASPKDPAPEDPAPEDAPPEDAPPEDAAPQDAAPKDPDPEEAPSASEAPAKSAEESGSSQSERLAQPGRRAQPVTVTMLKAAARSPEDVKEIVRVESRLREKKRAQPAEEPASQAAPTAAKGAAEAAPAPKAASPTPGKPSPKPQSSSPQSSKPQSSKPQSPQAPQSSKPQSSKPQSPQAPQPSSAKAAPTPAAQARAPQPAPPKRAPQAAPPKRSAESDAPPAAPPAEAPSQAAPQRPSSLPLAAAILAAGALVTWAIRSSQPAPPSASASPAVAAASPSPSAVALPGPPAPTPSRRGSLASFGRDHVVYSDGSGELVVLKGDPVSGELSLERVYVVRRDRQRDLGDPARPLHGVYLDDLHLERAEELRAATLEFKTRLAEAHRKREGLELVDAAAVRLARAGGADLLIPLLEPTHPTLDRRAATIGLLESRYRCALPHVAGLIRRYKDGPQGRRLCELSGALIGQRLDPREPEAAAEAIEAWCREHPLLDRFEQVTPPPGADPPR